MPSFLLDFRVSNKARTRWLLSYTLLNNPSLSALRKPKWGSSPTNVLLIPPTTDATGLNWTSQRLHCHIPHMQLPNTVSDHWPIRMSLCTKIGCRSTPVLPPETLLTEETLAIKSGTFCYWALTIHPLNLSLLFEMVWRTASPDVLCLYDVEDIWIVPHLLAFIMFPTFFCYFIGRSPVKPISGWFLA